MIYNSNTPRPSSPSSRISLHCPLMKAIFPPNPGPPPQKRATAKQPLLCMLAPRKKSVLVYEERGGELSLESVELRQVVGSG